MRIRFQIDQLLTALVSVLALTAPFKANAAPVTSNAGYQLTAELRDGSRVVGQIRDDTLSCHSAVLGELTLSWASIRALECAEGHTPARLTATNGDVYQVELANMPVRVETSYGQFDLPVNQIRGLTVSAVSRPGQLPPGLVALWSGEGDGRDAVGGNTMELMDMTFADGQVGQAFSFNGETSTIRIPASPSLDVGTSEGFTIMAWIKPTQIDGYHPLFQWTDSMPIQCSIGQRPSESGGLMACITDGQGNRFLDTYPGVIMSGVWQHIAVTFDKAGGTATWYVNGVIVAQRKLDGQVTGTKGDLVISRRDITQGNWTSNRSFAGLMDEIALSPRALSAAEIQTICTDQNHGGPLTLPAPSTGWYDDWMR